MTKPWPASELAHQDTQIEAKFARFDAVIKPLREMRSSQNIGSKDEVQFTLTCDTATAELLKPIDSFFKALAKSNCEGLGAGFKQPEVPATMTVDGMQITVDLGNVIDV